MNADTQETLEENVLSKAQMIATLQEFGIHCTSTKDIDVVVDLFEAVKSSGGTIFDEQGVSGV